MPIISVRDNEIDERERQKTMTEKKKWVTQAIVKVWEKSGFDVHLN